MEGEKSLERFSPEVRIEDLSVRDAVSLLPPIILFHGTGDYSIPAEARLESQLAFVECLIFLDLSIL